MNQSTYRPLPSRLSRFDWNDLKYFLAVARTGTIRGAAIKLVTNHATVSRRITALEDATRARLFDRAKSGLALTQLGEDLFPIAERIEDEIASAARLIAGRDSLPSGAIYVSMPPFLAFSSVTGDLALFGKLHPEIDVHLGFTNTVVRLDHREADISIRYAQTVEDDVYGRKLVDCRKAVYCTPEYAAQIQDNAGIGLHFIGWNEPEEATSASWIRKSDYPKASLRFRCFEVAPQVAMALEGVGMTMLPCFVGDRIQGLVRPPYQGTIADRKLWLLLHGDLRKTARIRLLLDFLQERICSRRAEFAGELVTLSE
ncbi:LysR family transcriptional regulator [Falsihalocynthiibacter sp. BN13B15]|uniref:LysR family transcriptional regulator n=1 Tax=Falsihalocynthiibacter sp. BN13B15 TaxID=3240871 RepID=UPI00351083D2